MTSVDDTDRVALVTELKEQADGSEESNAKSSVYNPFVAIDTAYQQAALVVHQKNYTEILPDEAITEYHESENEEVVDSETITEATTAVTSSINELMVETNPILSDWWLQAAQTVLITSYCKSNGYSEVEEDLLLNTLASLQVDLTDRECLVLANTLVTLVNDVEVVPDTTPQYGAGVSSPKTTLKIKSTNVTFTVDSDMALAAQFSSILLQISKSVNETHRWMQRCLGTYVAEKTADEGLRTMYSQVSANNWSGNNWKQFFDACEDRTYISDHMKFLHIIQTSDSIDPTTVIDVAQTNTGNVLSTISTDVAISKEIDVIIEEIRSTNLVDEDKLTKTASIMTSLYSLIEFLNIPDSYESILSMYRTYMMGLLEKIGTAYSTLTNEKIGHVLLYFYSACYKYKGWALRKPQIVAITLLLLYSKQPSNILLEVATGEGKSAILAVFTVILALQNKHVDIVTSSPILAQRDVEEWKEFYEFFGVTVDHNSYLNREGDTKDVQLAYKKMVVYGTVGHFAADILREEFQHEVFRSVRRLDVVLVDEVDMLMLDEGVQFTYLSHNAAVLQHLEPVIAAVWGIIGPLRLTMNTDGENFYAGGAKLVTQAIYECLDPEYAEVESQADILGVAKTLGIVTTSQYNVLIGDDQLAKKETIAELTIADGLALIAGLQDYENMPEFLAYKMDSKGLLEQVTTVSNEDSAEALLLLEDGLACILNPLDKIIERAVAIVKEKLNFSDTDNEGSIKLPKLMEEFIISQLSIYVKNALRALHMEQDREYTILSGKIVPVDFENSGVIELNKKWGGGLQQMLEIKHNISLTPISLVTNFMSNLEFFSRYKENGGIYGMSGTLGLDEHSNTSMFLRDMFDTKVCSIPTFKTRKFIEKAPVFVDNEQQWFQEIVDAVNKESRETQTWRGKRASLILCEDIKSAQDLKKICHRN